MTSEKMALLKRLTFEIMQKMCFLFPSDEPTSPEVSAGNILVRVDCGQLYQIYLRFDSRLAETIAQNLLGTTSEALDDTLRNSALTEIANMVGGNFVNQMNMDTSDKVSIPQIVESDWNEQYFEAPIRISTEWLYFDKRPLQLAIVERVV